MAERIYEVFGGGVPGLMKSFLVMSTLSASDMRHLLIKQNDTIPPLLYETLNSGLDRYYSKPDALVKDSVFRQDKKNPGRHFWLKKFVRLH